MTWRLSLGILAWWLLLSAFFASAWCLWRRKVDHEPAVRAQGRGWMLTARLKRDCFPVSGDPRETVHHIASWWKPWKWCCANCLWVWLRFWKARRRQPPSAKAKARQARALRELEPLPPVWLAKNEIRKEWP